MTKIEKRMDNIIERLFSLADKEYADFQCKLTPGIPRESFIGVRSPQIKELAKAVIKEGSAEEFLKELPHSFYDENILHSAILSKNKDFDDCLEKTENFLPYIDNWAVCDTLSPIVLKKNKKILIAKIKRWISSDKTYTRRFGVKLLMNFFLDEEYKKNIPTWLRRYGATNIMSI